MTMDNSGFARRIDDTAGALAAYDHLPRIGLITISSQGFATLSPDASGQDAIIAVGQWARAFEVPAVLRTIPTNEVRANLKLGGVVDVDVHVYLSTSQVHELCVRLGVAMTPDGVEVSAEQLLAALRVDQDAARPCNDEQCISSGRAALCATHDTEYFATQRATVSTVEIAAGGVL